MRVARQLRSMASIYTVIRDPIQLTVSEAPDW